MAVMCFISAKAMRTFFVFLILFSSSKAVSSDCEDDWDSGFTLRDIKVFIQETTINTPKEYLLFVMSGEAPKDFPLRPDIVFEEDWIDWDDFFSGKLDYRIKDRKPLEEDRKPKKNRTIKSKKKEETSTRKFSVSYEEVKAYAHSLNLDFEIREKFREYISENDWPEHFPRNPDEYFKEEFEGWTEFLGYTGPLKKDQFSVSYRTVKAYAHSLNLGFGSRSKFKKYISENPWPAHFPRNPDNYFKEEFEDWPKFLGYEGKLYAQFLISYKTVKAYAHSLNLGFKTRSKFKKYISENDWPEHFPRNPDRYFEKEFEGWPKFLGYKGKIKPLQFSVPYRTVKAYAHSLNLGFGSGEQFKKYISENPWPAHFPRNPDRHFQEDFEGWPKFLGYRGKTGNRFTVSYEVVKTYAHYLNLGFGSGEQFQKYISENPWPAHFPRNPDRHFQEDFEGWPKFLGYKGQLKNGQFSVLYRTVKAYAHSLNLGFGSRNKFKEYISKNPWPAHFPRNPDEYFKEDFEGWPKFLGYTGQLKEEQFSVPYRTVKDYAHSLNLDFGSGKKFRKYISENDWPAHFPRNPDIYFEDEFESWAEFLGHKQLSDFYKAVKDYAHSLNLGFGSGKEFKKYISENDWPAHFPRHPDRHFQEDFEGWAEFLGYREEQEKGSQNLFLINH